MAKEKIKVEGKLVLEKDYDCTEMSVILNKGEGYISDQKFDLESYLIDLNGKKVRITIEVL